MFPDELQYPNACNNYLPSRVFLCRGKLELLYIGCLRFFDVDGYIFMTGYLELTAGYLELTASGICVLTASWICYGLKLLVFFLSSSLVNIFI